MSSSMKASGTGTHHQQQPHLPQYRRPYDSSGSDQKVLDRLHDSKAQADHTVSPSNSDQARSVTADPSHHDTDPSNAQSTSSQAPSIAADLSHNIVHEDSHTPNTSDSSDAKSMTSSPRKIRSDQLSISDLAFIALTLSPSVMHLYGRCFARNSTPRQIGTWFALLTLPISAPLYRRESLPHYARDLLEILSYGSTLTISIDIAVVGCQYLTQFPPTNEWQWLIFYPAFVAAIVCWLVVVGIMWGLVI